MPLPLAGEKLAPSDVHDILRVRRIELVDGNNKSCGTIAAFSAGAGIWLHGPAGHSVEIAAVGPHTFVGVRRRGNSGPVDMAMAIDSQGPSLQIAGPDGNVKVVTLEKLRELLT